MQWYSKAWRGNGEASSCIVAVQYGDVTQSNGIAMFGVILCCDGKVERCLVP